MDLGHVFMAHEYICQRALPWVGTCLAEVGGTQMVAAMGAVAEVGTGRDDGTRLICLLSGEYVLRLVCPTNPKSLISHMAHRGRLAMLRSWPMAG